MFIKGDMFERLLCCRRKTFDADEEKGDRISQEEVVLQHTNNNNTEYITSSQLLQRLKGGTTAVVALVREKRLVVAWLGDSQALLVRKRKAVEVVHPHTPAVESERQRIEDEGGCVLDVQGTWRVLGQLAVSRAIGDIDYKPYVSSTCDIKSLEISGDEDFLILACDGLWDILTPAKAVNIVYSYLLHNQGETDGVGRCLVEAARVAGSEDNITAVVVFLRHVPTLMEEERERMAMGEVPQMEDEFVPLQKDAQPPSISAIFSPPTPPTPSPNPSSQPLSPPTPDSNSPSPQPPSASDDGSSIASVGEAHPCSDKFMMNNVVSAPLEGAEPPTVSFPPVEGAFEPGHPMEKDEQEEREEMEKDLLASPVVEKDVAPPTQQEVDEALAELDSIPDGTDDIGGGGMEEEEEEEEEWAYYKMEHNTNAQKDDLLVGYEEKDNIESSLPETKLDTPSPQPTTQDTLPMEEEEADEIPVEEPLQPQSLIVDIQAARNVDVTVDSKPGSSSPKSVEGFVTSVELNTPEESFNTNLAINQTTDMFNMGAPIEQSSGPFSVYVSSSPEPASLEAPPVQQQSLMDFASAVSPSTPAGEETQIDENIIDVNNDVQDMIESPIPPVSATVEIVHAQSTVEVLPSDSPMDIPPGGEMDIMTQSMTGDVLPQEPMPLVSTDLLPEPTNPYFEGGFMPIPEATENPEFVPDLILPAMDFVSPSEMMQIPPVQETPIVDLLQDDIAPVHFSEPLPPPPQMEVDFTPVTGEPQVEKPEEPVQPVPQEILEPSLKSSSITTVVESHQEKLVEDKAPPKPATRTSLSKSTPLVKPPTKTLASRPSSSPAVKAPTSSKTTSKASPLATTPKASSLTKTSRPISAPKPPTTKPLAAKPTRPSTTKPNTTAKAPAGVHKPTPKPTTTKPSSTTSNTARVPLAKKTTTTTRTAVTKPSTTSRLSSSSLTKPPLKSITSTTSSASKDSSTRTSTTTTKRPLSTTTSRISTLSKTATTKANGPSATGNKSTSSSATTTARTTGGVGGKDTKNTTNRLLSTRSTTTTGARTTTTTKPTGVTTKSTVPPMKTTRPAVTSVRNAKTPGLRKKADPAIAHSKKTSSTAIKQVPLQKKEEEDLVALCNGENKIAAEEGAVEVKSKLIEDVISEKVTQMSLQDDSAETQQGGVTEMVNGDH